MHDVVVPMLMDRNGEMAALLASEINPQGGELRLSCLLSDYIHGN